MASLTQTRDTLVKLRTALKNKINNILSARGLNLPKEALSSEKRLNEVLSLPFDAIVQIELRVIVEQIRSLNKSVADLEKTIGDAGSKWEGHKGLSSIKGIGKTTGAILLSVIGDVNDFADEAHLASYFGIVPRVSNSNETEHSGRIHKRGSELGRTALVQSALIAANYRPYLKRFYEQVKARRGAGKAIIALAKKFLGVIYRTLKNKWVFLLRGIYSDMVSTLSGIGSVAKTRIIRRWLLLWELIPRRITRTVIHDKSADQQQPDGECMTQLVGRFWCSVPLLLLAPVAGQTQPDVAEILKKVSETYSAAAQYEARSALTSADPDANPRSMSSHLVYRSPNMYRLEVKMTLGNGQQDPALLAKDEFLNVFDGSTLWSYLPKLNEYTTFTTRVPEGMSPEGVDRFFGIGSFRDLVGAAPGRRARVLREERLATTSNGTADCYVIELADPLSTSLVWIDKKRYYVLREDEHIRSDGKAETRVEYTMLKLNEPLEGEPFKFVAPPGARKVPPE